MTEFKEKKINMKVKNKSSHRKIRMPIIFNVIIIIIITLFGVLPFLWLIVNSFKSAEELYKLPIVWLPSKLAFKNYVGAIISFPLVRYLLNSVLVSGTAAIISSFISLCAAYGMNKSKFKANNYLLIALLFTQLLPGVVILIPFYFLLLKFHLTDKIIGLILAYIIFFIPFGTLTLKSYLESAYPKELEESAEIDGCNEYQTFYKITLPLCTPGLAAIGIFAFIGSWNEFMFASILITNEKFKTIQQGLYSFSGQHASFSNTGAAFAAGAIIVFPVLLATFYIQRYMVTGLSSGALKE